MVSIQISAGIDSYYLPMYSLYMVRHYKMLLQATDYPCFYLKEFLNTLCLIEYYFQHLISTIITFAFLRLFAVLGINCISPFAPTGE